MVLPRLPMTKTLHDLLTARFESAHMPVGLGNVPTIPRAEGSQTLVNAKPPYLILHPLWTVTEGPGLDDIDADSVWTYQANCYSLRGDQVEWMLDRLRETIVGRHPSVGWLHPLEVQGMHVVDRRLGTDIGADPSSGTNGVLQWVIAVTPDYE